ncbi:MAG TPA: hypothetical protein VL588_02495 [Bdellovibrionota bacterium]|nr:hypothetical protein [Bdellovibrionota bacterium]
MELNPGLHLRRAAGPVLRFAGLWIALNVALKGYAAYSQREWLPLVQPSVEVLLAFLVLSLLWLRPGGPGKLARSSVAGALCGLFLFETCQIASEVILGRPFSMAADLPLADNLVSFALDSFPTLFVVLGLLALLGILILVYFVFLRAVTGAAGFLERPSHRWAFGASVLALFAGATLHWRHTGEKFWSFFHEHAVMDEFSAQLVPVFQDTRFQFRAHAARRDVPPLSAVPLKGLRGRNVYLFVIESYGETAYTDERHRAELQPQVDALEGAIRAAGFSMRSGYLLSPVHTNGSWMAESTFSCGLKVQDNRAFNDLLSSDVPCLSRHFAAAGYRTLEVRPGTRTAWPEGKAFFRFDESLFLPGLGYEGPALDWATAPDQYSLEMTDRQYLSQWRKDKKPFFAEFVGISSHAPFAQVPQYFSDLSRIDDRGHVYQGAHVDHYLMFSSLGYVASIKYELKTLQDYITRRVDDGALVLIFGDHQPLRTVSGFGSGNGVPFHALSRDPEALLPFLTPEWTSGWIPRADAQKIPMERFLSIFLRGFGSNR